MARSVAEIDALLQSQKHLFPGADWVEDAAVAKFVSPVVDRSGGVIGGMLLHLNVQIESLIQWGNAVLSVDRVAIQRMSFRPNHIHVNGAAFPTSQQLRLKRLPPGRSRLYRWANNRAWPIPEKVSGYVLEPEPSTVGDAFARFLEACGISAYVPDPLHRPRLEL